MEQAQDTLVLYVNGTKVEESNPDPEWSLLHYLRTKMRLVGTKRGCSEGGCGACTVMVSTLHGDTLSHSAVLACLTPLCSLHGLAVTTVEGLGGSGSAVHAVQRRLAASHGSQCGFCTPGMVMSMSALLRNCGDQKPSGAQIQEAIQGNVCRCTGYRSILEGFGSVGSDQQACCQGTPKSEDCCRVDGGSRATCCKSEGSGPCEPPPEGCCLNKGQEVTFPPALRLDSARLGSQSLKFRGPRVTWLRPSTLEHLTALRARHPEAVILAGNTKLTFHNSASPPSVVLCCTAVAELRTLQKVQGGVKVGSAVTLTELCLYLSGGEERGNPTAALLRVLREIGSAQTRGAATLGGNLLPGGRGSDLAPLLVACSALLEVLAPLEGGGHSTRVIDLGKDPLHLAENEVLVSVTLPDSPNTVMLAYRQPGAFTAAFHLTLDPEHRVTGARVALGGVSRDLSLAERTAEMLQGVSLAEHQLPPDAIVNTLACETAPSGSGQVSYRSSVAEGLFSRCWLEARHLRGLPIREDLKEAVTPLPNYLGVRGVQTFEKNVMQGSVGKPQAHLESLAHATGRAEYCDDTPPRVDELFAAPLLSSRAHAQLLAVDPLEALALPGVVAFLSAQDIKPSRCNNFGVIAKDEPLFAVDKVENSGAMLGVVVAESSALARRAARLIRASYQDLQPLILTIEEAIAAGSYFTENLPPRSGFTHGDVIAGLAGSEHVLEGEVRLGGQEHFYMEPQSARAEPTREGLSIVSSTQSPAEMQRKVCELLGLPMHEVSVSVPRVGGAFGGKQSRAALVTLPVALAAHRLGRAVRCALEREEDMQMTGGRHPFLAKYKVGCSADGRLQALKVDLFCNAGSSLDFSGAVMGRALFHVQNSYHVPHLEVRGHVCRTHLPSNTAFRGFGRVQASFVAESIVEHVSSALSLDPAQVRELNLYGEGEVAHYGQKVEGAALLRRCWMQCKETAGYEAVRREATRFNNESRWRKRGVSMVPVTYGIGFDAVHLNQAGALVHVYKDGSVLLSHGGVEMGQGLHTKMAQIASTALGVPVELIRMSDTSTASVPNTTSTAGSCSTDINGMAVKAACEELSVRLAPYRAKQPAAGWSDWVLAAYLDRVSLSASGFYRTPDLSYDWEGQKGRMYNYYTFGAACAHVELDVLTGQHKVLRVDIVMDVGRSLNPALDVGQIEGAFLQGVGLLTSEQIRLSPQGKVLTRGPLSYQVPRSSDAPAQINVSLLANAANPRAVHSSKAIGEPPLVLSNSVWGALRMAVTAARAEAKLPPLLLSAGLMRAPATPQRLRLACVTRTIDDKAVDSNACVEP